MTAMSLIEYGNSCWTQKMDDLTDRLAKVGALPLGGGSSRSGQCSDHADLTSDVVTCPSFSVVLAVTNVMDRSEK